MWIATKYAWSLRLQSSEKSALQSMHAQHLLLLTSQKQGVRAPGAAGRPVAIDARLTGRGLRPPTAARRRFPPSDCAAAVTRTAGRRSVRRGQRAIEPARR